MPNEEESYDSCRDNDWMTALVAGGACPVDAESSPALCSHRESFIPHVGGCMGKACALPEDGLTPMMHGAQP